MPEVTQSSAASGITVCKDTGSVTNNRARPSSGDLGLIPSLFPPWKLAFFLQMHLFLAQPPA